MSRVFSFAMATLLALAANSQLATAQVADDGWRHTAQGWERVDLFGRQVVAAPKPAEPARRFDTHPAALALLQIITIMGAMIAFPRPNVSRLGWLNESWWAVFRRSFRASVFGS